MPPSPRVEGSADSLARPPDPLTVKVLPVLLACLVPFGKAATGRQRRGIDVHEEVAAALDEHRHGDGLEPAIGLESLEFIELEGPG